MSDMRGTASDAAATSDNAIGGPGVMIAGVPARLLRRYEPNNEVLTKNRARPRWAKRHGTLAIVADSLSLAT
jgi:hypothetical protein